MKCQSYLSSIATELGKLKNLKDNLAEIENEYKTQFERASNVCPEIISRKKVEDLETVIREHQIRIEQGEAESGGYEETQQKYQKLAKKVSEYNQMYKRGKFLLRVWV